MGVPSVSLSLSMVQEDRNIVRMGAYFISASPSPGALLGSYLECPVTAVCPPHQIGNDLWDLLRIPKFQATAFLIPSMAGWQLSKEEEDTLVSCGKQGHCWAGVPADVLLWLEKSAPSPHLLQRSELKRNTVSCTILLSLW